MRRWFAVLAFLVSLFFPASVQARPDQAAPSNVTLQNLEVDIWPEYDRPGVLIIYRINLSSDVKLPADLTFRIPVAAGQPSAVAEQTANGLFNVQYTSTGRDGNWELINFTTTLPQIQIEYYDPGLTKNGSARTFAYNWPGDYPITDLTVKIQQPRTASQLTIGPKTGTASTASDGLRYYEIPVGKVNGGETFTLNLSYQKSDDSLTQSAAFEQVTPIPPASNNNPGQLTLNQILPWLLGGLGLLLVAGGIIWYLRGGASNPEPVRRHGHAPASTEKNSGESIFCSQCGKKASGSDAFCRSCGAKLRK